MQVPTDTLAEVEVAIRDVINGSGPPAEPETQAVVPITTQEAGEVAAAIEEYRSPPRPYDTDWTATMDIRAWVVAGGGNEEGEILENTDGDDEPTTTRL